MPDLSTSPRSAPQAQYPVVLLTLLLIILIAMGGTLVCNTWGSAMFFKNEVLHTFLEATGAVSALTLTLMIMLSKSEHEDQSLAFVTAAGLISMCVLDAMHSMVQPGDLFVWLRSCSTFVGGFYFALAWCTPLIGWRVRVTGWC